MAIVDDLKRRIAEIEAEVATIEPKLLQLRETLRHYQAVLSSEESRAVQIPLLPSERPIPIKAEVNGTTSVYDMTIGLFDHGAVVTYGEVRDFVREHKMPDRDAHQVGKQVAAALNRGVKKGMLEKVSRGTYRGKAPVET